MLKRFKNSYYSKIMIVCIAAVCAITAILLPVCSSLIHQQERSEDLKKYDLILDRLTASMTSRQEALATNLTPFFSDEANTQNLCSFYRSTSKKVPLEYRDSVMEMLRSFCFSDSYCCGALLLTVTGHLYQYNSLSHTLVPLSLRSLTTKLTPYELQLFTDQQLMTLSNDLQKPAPHIYGLGTSVFDQKNDSVNYLGTMIFLYSTAEYSSLLSSADLQKDGTFAILDQNQHVIFSSDENYESADGLLPALSDSSKGEPSHSTQTQHGTTYYASSQYHEQYHFYTVYQVPKSVFTHSAIITVLTVISVCICLAAILLYILAFYISDRKIHSIQKAMGLIGTNNLDYRLPVPKNDDEFTQIIKSFNRMCDYLQRNVEKAYLYEIAQRKAELYAMQTSINPHFLYNALEQIRVQILKSNSAAASHMLLLLSKMYRNQTRRNLYITIAEECSQSENLINFYMYRYGDFEYEFNIHSSIKIYGIPKNTLQPLIENYFVHGFIPDSDENLLTISAHPVNIQDTLWIEFCVEDNGSSITEEELVLLKEKLAAPVMSRSENNGFALSNVNHRLKLVFGNDSGLVPGVGSDGTGFAVRFRIPAILPEDLQKT